MWTRVGKEPSGTAFNSLVQLEVEKGVPRNPFINAGAIVMADILMSHLENPKEDFLAFVRAVATARAIEHTISHEYVGVSKTRNAIVTRMYNAIGYFNVTADKKVYTVMTAKHL